MKLIGTALVCAGLVCGAHAQQGADHIDIWSPFQNVKDQRISLVSWGSGSIGQANDVANDGAFSIRVSTHNYFQGGILSFANPKDVSKSFGDPANLLQITVRTADQVILHSGGAPIGGSGSGGGGGGGKFGGKGIQPADQGGGDLSPGGQKKPQETTATTSESATSTLTRVRIIITTTDGRKSEAYLPLPITTNTPWHSIAIPLQKISGFDKTNKVIQQIAFAGDATTTYYIGDIRLIHDSTPITGEMNAKEALNLALGDTVQFKGWGDGGSTVLNYSWCFDSAGGFVEDARGPTVSHRFRKPGNYIVTLMVSDIYGAKKPFTATQNVTVNP